MNRRAFAKVCLVASVIPFVAKVSEARVPTIWGDGIHDDIEGLQAFVDGKPFVNRSSGVIEAVDGRLILAGGAYTLSAPLNLRGPVSMTGVTVRLA